MEFIPIKTRVMHPPQDDLWAVLDEYLTDLKNGDVILISSKIVAIHQGRTVLKSEATKEELIAKEADMIIEREYFSTPLTAAHHAFLGTAGIDESNGNGYYILLPEKVFDFAKEIHTYLCQKHSLEHLGVIVTDSYSTPFRYGAMGVGLGWWGIEPLEDHAGRADLFGRNIVYERSNVIDALAAGAIVVSGEVDECMPIVVARNVPRLEFTNKDTKDKLLVPYEEDLFRVLYERFL